MGSTSTFGSYDLDLRAPPLKRHTMGVWLQDCPECGYINYSVEELIPGAPEVVRSPEFQHLRQDRVMPELVLSFKRHALLVSADPIEAGWALLHSAWTYDDLKQGGEPRSVGRGVQTSGPGWTGLSMSRASATRRCSSMSYAAPSILTRPMLSSSVYSRIPL